MTTMTDIGLFALNTSRTFAEDIASRLKIPVSPAEERVFEAIHAGAFFPGKASRQGEGVS